MQPLCKGQISFQESFYLEVVLCCTVFVYNASTDLSQILGKGGTFVCRCYELLTRFSAGVLFVAYKLFREVHVHSPPSP